MANPAPTVQQPGIGVVTADNLNTFVQTVTNFAQLRSFTGLNGMTVFAQGGVSVNDGLQGLFTYNSLSTATDNGVTIIVPTGNIQGAWIANPIIAGLTPVTRYLGNSSGVYTPSVGLVYAMVEAVGAGGGGGGAAGSSGQIYCGGGGGAGQYGRCFFTAAQIGASQTVTINPGGAGGGGASNGANGGATTFGSLMAVAGGSGGSYNSSGGGFGVGGAGGVTGTVGVSGILVDGNAGQTGATFYIDTLLGVSAMGGSSFFGGVQYAPTAGTGVLNGASAEGYGSGGNGAVANNTTGTATGGQGGAGTVIVTEFVST